MYEERPRIFLVLQLFDKWVEALALNGCIWLWLFCIRAYTILPDIIPTHFNFKGVADGYGSRSSLFVLPVIASCIYVLITGLNKYPHMFNYMVTITEKNAETQYRLATRLLRVMKLMVIIVFAIVIIMIATSAKDAGISRWLSTTLPIVSVLFIVPTIRYFYNTVRANRIR